MFQGHCRGFSCSFRDGPHWVPDTYTPRQGSHRRPRESRTITRWDSTVSFLLRTSPRHPRHVQRSTGLERETRTPDKRKGRRFQCDGTSRLLSYWGRMGRRESPQINTVHHLEVFNHVFVGLIWGVGPNRIKVPNTGHVNGSQRDVLIRSRRAVTGLHNEYVLCKA